MDKLFNFSLSTVWMPYYGYFHESRGVMLVMNKRARAGYLENEQRYMNCPILMNFMKRKIELTSKDLPGFKMDNQSMNKFFYLKVLINLTDSESTFDSLEDIK